MRIANYRITSKQATGYVFGASVTGFPNFCRARKAQILVKLPEAPHNIHYKPEAPLNKFLVLKIFLLLCGFFVLWLLNRDRLKAYDECYMQNYIEWGSCNELGK